MLPKEESIKSLKNYFNKNKIATVNELMALLKTTNRMSVFRRLKEADYISSFSASGKYYTLKNIAMFNKAGLWIFNEIGFSRFGNLKETLIFFIEESDSGKTYDELKNKIQINLREALHHALLDLVKSKKIARIIIENTRAYVYTSINKMTAQKQISCRNNLKLILKENSYPDWVIIEILASVIRSSQGVKIDAMKIALELNEKEIMITAYQVEYVLSKFNLKKTPDSQ